MRRVDPHEVLSLTASVLLDLVRLARQPLDLVDAALVLTIAQANAAALLRDPTLRATYATFGSVPPAALCRPIRINAAAGAARLPFETARRRAQRLVLIGVCRSTAAGLILAGPAGGLATPRGLLEIAYHGVQALHERLSAAGALYRIAPPPEGERVPLRAAGWLMADYLLRLAELGTEAFGDLVDAAIWLEVFRSNTEHAASSGRLRAEADRRAVRPAVVARRLGLPEQTVRRRVHRLAASGACVSLQGGAVVTDRALRRPAVARLAERNRLDLIRLYQGLAALAGPGSSASNAA